MDEGTCARIVLTIAEMVRDWETSPGDSVQTAADTFMAIRAYLIEQAVLQEVTA